MPVISGGGAGAAFPTQKGAGAPLGAVTPSGIGAVYVDTTNGGIHIAVGVTNADWIAVGGLALFDEAGMTNFVSGGFRDSLQLGVRASGLSDVAAQSGSGNGLTWRTAGADGDQTLFATVGTGGGKNVTLADANGSLGPPDGGIKFPTANPHIAGAWYDNAGVLTKSAG